MLAAIHERALDDERLQVDQHHIIVIAVRLGRRKPSEAVQNQLSPSLPSREYAGRTRRPSL